jgi:hypothetical protein
MAGKYWKYRVKLFLWLGVMTLMVIIAPFSVLNYYYTTIYPLDRDVKVHLNYVTKLTDADPTFFFIY